MLFSDAKDYYFEHMGDGYYMFLDETKKYEEFKAMQIPDNIRAEWDEEMLNDLFEHLHDEPSDVWAKHGRILKVLQRGHCDYVKWGKKLLDEMDGFDYLDKKNKILIIENMGGRDRYLKNGGAFLIITKTPYAKRLDEIMQYFMDFYVTEDDYIKEPGWDDIRDRYNRAVLRYNRVYRKWTERPGDEVYRGEE